MCLFFLDAHAVLQWNDGAVKEDDGTIAPGQAELSDLINDAHDLIADLLESLPEEEEEA
jgi:hypothetical protein